ncbi:MAG: hypothetical protein RIC19_09400 [Phaeodactylibacter sp.]|uniref:hypothetical protein n=1 Tax=Phaeodactylibacter sp. TaxID=1940289 RepID=UPI0032EC7DA5
MTYSQFSAFLEVASKEELYEALCRAHEVINDEQRFYISHAMESRKKVATEPAGKLLQYVQTFEQRSRAGYFYREFDMSGDDYDWVPPHTDAWFYELGLWLDRACELAQAPEAEVARKIFDICLPLIDDMSEGIAFAHDLGSWMIPAQHDYLAVYEQLKARNLCAAACPKSRKAQRRSALKGGVG